MLSLHRCCITNSAEEDRHQKDRRAHCSGNAGFGFRAYLFFSIVVPFFGLTKYIVRIL